MADIAEHKEGIAEHKEGIAEHKEEIAEESLADEIAEDNQPHHHDPHYYDDGHHHHNGDAPEEVDEGSSSSSSSSDGEGEKVAPVKDESSSTTQVKRLFGREKPVHQVLGGGKPADVFLWRNKKVSAGVLGTATLIWVLFELLEYHFLTLICHVAIFTLAVVFMWANVSTFINKTPPRVPEISLPEKPLMEFAMAVRDEINRGLALLRAVASGRELKKFLGMIAGLWLLSILGSSFNFLTLFYIIFVVLHTLPALYEKHEDKVDSFAERTAVQAKKHYSVVNDKYLSKLPKVVNQKYFSKFPKVSLKSKKAE